MTTPCRTSLTLLALLAGLSCQPSNTVPDPGAVAITPIEPLCDAPECLERWQPTDDFVMTWRADPGKGTTVFIPTGEGDFDYWVDWDNDGTFDVEGVDGGISHDFATPGDHTIRIRGRFPHMDSWSRAQSDFRRDHPGAPRLINVSQWGAIRWGSMRSMFAYQSDLTLTATDAPNLSGVRDMSYMFLGAKRVDADLSAWDTSRVTDMSSTFREARAFDGDLSTWDTSRVENMSGMFSEAIAFNQDITRWDTSNVRDMSAMFGGAVRFDQPIGRWDTSRVEDMSGMFAGYFSPNRFEASATPPTRRGWAAAPTTSPRAAFSPSVRPHGISVPMYDESHTFNQDITQWDTSNVRSMSRMFWDGAFNQPIGGWDTSKVETMRAMFTSNAAFDQDIGGWDTSRVRDMDWMFKRATAFNQDIGGWDTSSVEYMSDLFYEASTFDQDLGGWDVRRVEHFFHMLSFSGMSQANYDNLLEGWSQRGGLPRDVAFVQHDVAYCRAGAARRRIERDFGWTFHDAGKRCP